MTTASITNLEQKETEVLDQIVTLNESPLSVATEEMRELFEDLISIQDQIEVEINNRIMEIAQLRGQTPADDIKLLNAISSEMDILTRKLSEIKTSQKQNNY